VATLEMIPLARFVQQPRLGRPAVQGPVGDRQCLRRQGRVRIQSHQTVVGRAGQ
jgi:hypothetical protein